MILLYILAAATIEGVLLFLVLLSNLALTGSHAR